MQFANNDIFGGSAWATTFGNTTAVYRDPSAWYHLVIAIDTTQATAANRCKYYINGVLQTSGTVTVSQNADLAWNNSGVAHYIGARTDGGPRMFFDGLIADFYNIDGQALTPSSFGETDTITGVWKPKKYLGTYGTNGFYLNFSDNSGATATTIGKDYSGNGNNWTPNNISVTSGTTYDSMLDVPTPYADGGNGRGNYAVLSPLDITNTTKPTDGNLNYSPSGVSPQVSFSSIAIPSSGKWYAEFTKGDTSGNWPVGIQGPTRSGITYASQTEGIAYWAGGQIYKDSVLNQSSLATATTGDVIGVAVDAGAQTVQFYKNGSTVGTAVSYTYSQVWFACGNYISGLVFNANFGQRPFAYTPPSGFKALNTQNLPAPTISNGALYMAATTYTGNGTSITVNNGSNTTNGTTFKPDLVWLKSRSSADQHNWMDTNRGVQYRLRSDATSAEEATPGTFTINSNGFTSATSNVSYNGNAYTYVAWQWQAGAGTTSSNTSGSITSTVSVNATAGFSVVSFNSGTAGNKTVGHGLGVAPSLIITKNRDGVASWAVWSSSFSNTAQGYLLLNGTGAVTNDSRQWANTAPTSTVFSFESGYTFTASNNIIAYCFSAVRGYSAFGSYTGNGSSDGPFVFLGFRPRWVMIKNTSAANQWNLWDTSRNTYNVMNDILVPSSSGAETNSYPIDILSNGFKIRGGAGLAMNDSSNVYIYAAFAENPFKLALAR